MSDLELLSKDEINDLVIVENNILKDEIRAKINDMLFDALSDSSDIVMKINSNTGNTHLHYSYSRSNILSMKYKTDYIVKRLGYYSGIKNNEGLTLIDILKKRKLID